MRIAVIIVACMLLVGVVPGGSLAAQLDFAVSGFTIDALEAKPGPTPYSLLIMSLPQTGMFAPNVNVVIQPYYGTLAVYMDLSQKEIASQGLTMLSSEVTSDGYGVIEYTGNMQGWTLRWYVKVAVREGKAYVATATATTSQWPEVSGQLIECVASFKLK